MSSQPHTEICAGPGEASQWARLPRTVVLLLSVPGPKPRGQRELNPTTCCWPGTQSPRTWRPFPFHPKALSDKGSPAGKVPTVPARIYFLSLPPSSIYSTCYTTERQIIHSCVLFFIYFMSSSIISLARLSLRNSSSVSLPGVVQFPKAAPLVGSEYLYFTYLFGSEVNNQWVGTRPL